MMFTLTAVILLLGTKELEFDSTTEFNLWREQEEERTPWSITG